MIFWGDLVKLCKMHPLALQYPCRLTPIHHCDPPSAKELSARRWCASTHRWKPQQVGKELGNLAQLWNTKPDVKVLAHGIVPNWLWAAFMPVSHQGMDTRECATKHTKPNLVFPLLPNVCLPCLLGTLVR